MGSYELMHQYMNSAFPFVDHLDRVHMRMKFFPLTAPVGSNLLFPDDTPTFRRLGPAYAVTHQGQCFINLPLVESRIRLSDKALCLLAPDPPRRCTGRYAHVRSCNRTEDFPCSTYTTAVVQSRPLPLEC